MRVRRDGAETRTRILEAACEVFGEKGYHDATHAEICRRADANTAAINYHFGSKDELYRAAWRHLAERADELYPLGGEAGAGASARARLRAHIGSLVRRMTDRGDLRHCHSIRMRELAHPTGLLDDEIAARIGRARKRMLSILRELLGDRATERDLELCEMSVVSQCLITRPRPRCRAHAEFWQFALSDVEHLVDHITRFSFSGIEAVRCDIEARDTCSNG